MFNIFESIARKEHYNGSSISFEHLIEKIRTPNPKVILARQMAKGPDYDDFKRNEIPAFFANSYTTEESRAPELNRYKKSTEYIYLDFDGFEDEGDAKAFQEKNIIPHPFIAACWISLSGRGLSALVNIKDCNKYRFDAYWAKLNELFDHDLDRQTCDYYRLCCVSYDPDPYVNDEYVAFNELYDFSYCKLSFKTFIPISEFEGKEFKVFPEGKEVWEINLFRYTQKKNGQSIRKYIKEGIRTKTLGKISLLLIHLNQDARETHLQSTLLSINRKYCDPPLKMDEVIKVFEANYRKYKKGKIEMSRYANPKRQFIFINKTYDLTTSEKMKIIRREDDRLKQRGPEFTPKKIEEAISTLMEQDSKITQVKVAKAANLCRSSVQNYWGPVKTKVKEHNRQLKKHTKAPYTNTEN